MSNSSEFSWLCKPAHDALTCRDGPWAQNRQQREDERAWNSSVDWLEENSLERRGLTLPRLLSQRYTASASPREDVGWTQQEISAESLSDFETQLHQAIELYHSRIQWLTQRSRKMFGVVRGCRLGVLIDSSDWTCSEDKLADLQHHLLLLTEEQFHMKKQLYFISFGTDITSLWDQPRDVTPRRLHEAQQWLLQLMPSGACNLLQALEHARGHAQLDTLLLVLGSRPDQSPDTIVDYMAQSSQEGALTVHAVAYNCCSSHAIDTVKNMAKVTGGRYHLYSAALGVVDSSTDLELLWAEIKAAQNLLQHVQDMPHGQLVVQVCSELDSLSLADVSCGPCVEICVEPPAPLPATSADWLSSHSLEAKQLDLYQVLAPNAYAPLEGYVPILGKSIHSTVHERAMEQFTWHDGTVKNVHVDLPSLKNYQSRLLEAERVLERRAEWLSNTASRQIWGTVCEQRVQVLLDVCGTNAPYQLHMRHAVRLLLQEQLPSTHSFSIIAFGSDVKSWRKHLAPPTHENLQEVWQWVQALECGGGRNTLAALRHAMGAELQGDTALTRGLYLLTTGVPDEDTVEVCDYAAASCHAAGVRLHVCLLTREEGPVCCHDTWSKTAAALRNLAHATNGRFHWITDMGIVESDDIILLVGEMKKAVDYWQKCSDLVDSLLRRGSGGDSAEALSPQCCSPASGPPARACRPGPSAPRPTRLSLARLSRDAAEPKDVKRSSVWRPSSAKAVIPAVSSEVRPVQSAEHRKVACSQSVFYLENGMLGAVFRTYLQPKSTRKCSSTAKLPKHEDVCSTKQWLKRFGIRSLDLDLHKLVSGPECAHRRTLVPTVHKSVSAKYCDIFPSVQLKGRLRHLFVSPGELRQYLLQAEKVQRRYARRTQWLLSGSRRVFGCVLEQAVCLVLDLSGSMASGLPGLQRELPTLIWDQLHANGVRFSMLAFSGEVQVWQAELVEATETRCREAVQWLGQLNVHGSTSVLQALQAACAFGDPLGVYVVSDGKPDCSRSLVLREAERLTAGKAVVIHTTTLSGLDSTARDFLKSLAHKTGGRFHQTPSHADTQTINQLLAQGFKEREDAALPAFEGDDLRRLKDEIEKLRMFQKQAKAFREIILERYPEATEPK
ncbi:von Willebrand factor A domain-containing protein 3A [Electrophorus electricus]|uniref:von Willebrand factor A domain-containing protein 3A n=1 Tax=Electrophorus electricus TaxID=8005 RepID=UPI0015CFF750|nr:von Willebrand factor A domain-containing protein 3A [Electrophorus electricus]